MTISDKVFEVALNDDEPSFGSFNAAVNTSLSAERQRRANVDSRRLNGRIVIDAKFSDRTLSLCFENGERLVFFIGDRKVTWKIQATELVELNIDDSQSALSPVVRLRYPGVADVETWDRREQASTFINRHFVMFSCSVAWVFFKLSGLPEVMLHRMTLPELQNDFLHYGEV